MIWFSSLTVTWRNSCPLDEPIPGSLGVKTNRLHPPSQHQGPNSHAPLSTAQLQHNQVVQVRRDTHQQRQQEMLQQQIQQQAMGLLAEAKQSVVMEFWRLLADFVALNPCPAHGFDTLPHQHPFMCLDDANCLKLVPFPP